MSLQINLLHFLHPMKNTLRLLVLWFSLWWTSSACAQGTTTEETMSVRERMAKARAVKAQKQADKVMGNNGMMGKPEKATPTEYKVPVDKVMKGPNGEVVRTGERGAKFYINKNGNKTYLSSNQ